ncbi:hypothetical protein [Treponema primitia]|uniref:hypothetical protein n=1 Tax=Treponema primitia TaxID=88058 RepID=UPI001FDFA165|nr:hypothetical protein [Treponema primitia]
MEKYAQHYANEQPEWARWAKDTSRRIWEEITPLFEAGKCTLLTEQSGTRIYMNRFYLDLLENAYQSPDDSADMIFPNETTLKIKIPLDHLRSINVTTDLVTYLGSPQEGPLPLIKLIFPRGIPDALVLSSMIPRRLMEAAILKIRSFLRKTDNKEYIQNKLIPYHQGKENQLRDVFNRIMVRPLECLSNLEEGEDFSFLFWSSFSGMIKSDFAKRNELENEDLLVLQSLYLIEIINNYYRAKAFKRKERSMAFNDLDILIGQPPYAYSIDSIIKFVNSKGVPLLGLYSDEDLQSWLHNKVTDHKEDELPALLLITGPADAKRYIKKENYYPFSLKLLLDGRPIVRKAVSDRWLSIIKDYQDEPAMEKDEEFERLLKRYVGELTPELMAVLTDKKLFLACDEMERGGIVFDNSRFFSPEGALFPMATLFLVNRKEMLSDARAILPFWYSIPLLISFISFLQKMKNIKGEMAKKKAELGGPKRTAPANKNRDMEIREAGQKLETEIVPPDNDIDNYLAQLENRWNTLLKKQAREDLLTDIQSLVRDRLRQTLRGQRHVMLTKDSLDKLARRIVEENPTLRDLHNQDYLRQYTVLYMVKLLLQVKF